MTIREIVCEWLVLHGYDGLFQAGECGCVVKDLMPCEDYIQNCEPGYRARCDRASEDCCEACADGGYHVQAEEPIGPLFREFVDYLHPHLHPRPEGPR